MLFSNEDLQHLTQSAVSASRKAGNLISNYANKSIEVENKTGGDSLASQVVTEVDRLSQELILHTLQPTFQKYDLALLTEESEDDRSRLEKDYFWCIDPLDGTLPFIESTPGYSVSIALVARDGTSQLGVVYDPVHGTLYQAIKGQGLMKNEVPWFPISDMKNNALTLVMDRSFLKHTQIDKIKEICLQLAYDRGLKSLKLIHQGGAAMNACWVLENSPACYFKFPKPKDGGGSLWDFAATSCLFSEAKTIVSDIHGNPLELNRVDSTFMNHHGALFATDQALAQQIMQMYSQL